MKALAVLIEATCYDPVTASTKVVRVCNRNDPRVTTWRTGGGDTGPEWRPILTKSPSVGLSVFNGAFSGFGQTTVDNFVMAATEKDLDDMAAYMWTGATIKIYAGDMKTAGFSLIFTAVGNGLTRKSNESLQVDLDTQDKRMTDRQLLYLSYAGTGDIEGTVDLQGVLKPMAFGNALYCQPVLIDPVRQIYQVHGYGPVESIYGVFEGGQPIGTGGNPAASLSGTYAAFRDTVVAEGQWIRHNNLGVFKLGAQPTFPITCHVKGDTNGVNDGTALVKVADIVKRMVTMNVASVTVSNASIAALNAAAPYPIDLYFPDQISITDAVAQCLLSIGGYWFWDSTAQMRFGRMRFQASSRTLSAQNDQGGADVLSVSQLPVSAPVWSLRFGANQCHFVHSGSDIPAQLLDISQQLTPFDSHVNQVFPPSSTPPISPIDGDVWPDTSVSPTVQRRWDAASATWETASAAYLATIGINVYDPASATPSTPTARSALVTLLGTSAAILSQGALATKSTANIDSDVVDGSTYARIKAAELTSGVPKLTIAGSGKTLGDSRNMPAVQAAGGRFQFTGAITYTCTTTTATISVAAGSLIVGGVSVSYNAMSANVTGTAGTTVSFLLYVNSNQFTAGAHTLQTTTSQTNVINSDAIVLLGECDVVFPSSGTGGGTGTGGGGTVGSCVEAESWVLTEAGVKRAKNVEPGDRLLVLGDDRVSLAWAPCLSNDPARAPCYRLRSQTGIELVCSDTTPLTLRDGSFIYPMDLKDIELPVLEGSELRWEPCSAEAVDDADVRFIYCGGRVYAAGTEPERMILTHNLIKQPSN